ncbi:MAG: helix-turn-helix domain-containing protein [Candidatus Eiseniibacteriota bacterium]
MRFTYWINRHGKGWDRHVDACFVIRARLAELGLEQKGLAAAAEVTESYVSQLLTRKKPPPAPDRTDIYPKMEEFLKLPRGRLSQLAELQRTDELRRNLGTRAAPLYEGVREFVLRKCSPSTDQQIRATFEKDAFGPLERLITQKLFDVVKRLAHDELTREEGVHLLARLSGRTYEQTRVTILEFLDTDVFSLSAEQCVSFMDPLIESWDIDLASFGMEIVLNRRLGPGHLKKLEFIETEPESRSEPEPGLAGFLRDRSLSGDVTEEETAFLKRLRFRGRRPTPLYYYRELQNLRDPLHFREGGDDS